MKKTMEDAGKDALRGFESGKTVKFTKEWYKEDMRSDDIIEHYTIDIDDNIVWKRRFEGGAPEAVENEFWEISDKIECVTGNENYQIVLDAVERIASQRGYAVHGGRPSKSRGKRVYLYFIGDYNREIINVEFVDGSSVMAYWWRPLWDRDSSCWPTVDDEETGYLYHSYQKFSPAEIRKEIEEKREIWEKGEFK